MALFDVIGDSGDVYEKSGAPSRVPGLKSKFVKYITSPKYKKRLEKQGVKNPDLVIKDRLSKLDQTEVNVGSAPSLMYMFSNPGQKEKVPALTVKSKDSDYTMMHELSHVTNYGDTFFDPSKNKYATDKSKFGDANSASGKGMSVNEMLYITNRSNLPQSLKNSIQEKAKSDQKWGSYINPTEGMSGDSHSFDPSELKSDLDAVRLLLNTEGLTKSFGDDIDESIIEKALNNPKIANEPHFQRMLKNFSKKNIVDINNNIAYNKVRKQNQA